MAKAIEIVSYSKFKTDSRYKKYFHNVEFNMDTLGFTLLSEQEVVVNEDGSYQKSLVAVNYHLYLQEIDTGTVVWRRTTAGWGLPYLYIFHKACNNGGLRHD